MIRVIYSPKIPTCRDANGAVPVVVGHDSRLLGLGCAQVHKGAAPVVFPVVPRVCDVDDVIAGHAQRWRVAVRLDVEIDANVEGVGTAEVRRGELGAELGVRWRQKAESPAELYEFQQEKTNGLTLRVPLVFEGRRIGPPLQGEVGHLSGALAQLHTAPTEQNPLQLEPMKQQMHV